MENLWKLESENDDAFGHSIDDGKILSLWQNELMWEDGHYVLPIPWRNDKPDFSNNVFVAKHLLKSLESRLDKTDLRGNYEDVLMKMVSDGYAELVPAEHLDNNDGKVWYLPHHAVVTEKKPG